jgi:hypothetical protein
LEEEQLREKVRAVAPLNYLGKPQAAAELAVAAYACYCYCQHLLQLLLSHWHPPAAAAGGVVVGYKTKGRV